MIVKISSFFSVIRPRKVFIIEVILAADVLHWIEARRSRTTSKWTKQTKNWIEMFLGWKSRRSKCIQCTFLKWKLWAAKMEWRKRQQKKITTEKKNSFNSLLHTICAIAVRFQTICMQQFVAHWNMVFSLTETIDKKSSERAQMLRFDVITYYTFQFCNISTTDKINSTFFFYFSFFFFFLHCWKARKFIHTANKLWRRQRRRRWLSENEQPKQVKWNHIKHCRLRSKCRRPKKFVAISR